MTTLIRGQSSHQNPGNLDTQTQAQTPSSTLHHLQQTKVSPLPVLLYPCREKISKKASHRECDNDKKPEKPIYTHQFHWEMGSPLLFALGKYPETLENHYKEITLLYIE